MRDVRGAPLRGVSRRAARRTAQLREEGRACSPALKILVIGKSPQLRSQVSVERTCRSDQLLMGWRRESGGKTAALQIGLRCAQGGAARTQLQFAERYR